MDTLGLLVSVKVHPADIQDRDGAKLLLTAELKERLPRIELIWADGGYAGKLIDWVDESFGKVKLEIVRRCDDVKGFVVLPRRWVVERTFGWICRYRRMSKDYEALTDTSECMIYAVMTKLMLKRLSIA